MERGSPSVIGWIATLVCAVVTSFGVTFVLARWSAPEAPVRSQVVVAPAPLHTPLRLRTLRGAAKLPRLRRAPGAASPAPAAPASASAPSSPSATRSSAPSTPPAASSSRQARPPAPAAASPPSLSDSLAPPASVLRARVPWPPLRRP